MPIKPFKIFVIDSDNNRDSSYIQDIGYTALLQSALNDDAEITRVDLRSVFDWMPAGHIHVQGFGSIQIMCNYQGNLNDDLILKMNQMRHQIRDIFKNNLPLVVHKIFNFNGNDDELNAMYLSIQYALGSKKYEDIRSKLAEVLEEHLKNAQEFIKRSDLLAREIHDTSLNYLNAVMEIATSSTGDVVEFEMERLKNEFDRQMSVLDSRVNADANATLAQQRPLRIKAELHRFFAKRVAEDYCLPQAAAVEDEKTMSSLECATVIPPKNN